MSIYSVHDDHEEGERVRLYAKSLSSKARKPRHGTKRKQDRRNNRHPIAVEILPDVLVVTCACGAAWETRVNREESNVRTLAKVDAVVATHRESPSMSGSHPFHHEPWR